MDFLYGFIGFIVGMAISAGALYLGGKITREDVEVLPAILIALAGALCSLIPIPFINGIIGWVVMLILITKWCGCDAFPNGVLLIVVANVLQYIAIFIIAATFVSCTANPEIEWTLDDDEDEIVIVEGVGTAEAPPAPAN